MEGELGRACGVEVRYLWELTILGTHGVRPYGIWDEGALLSLNFHLSTLNSHLSPLLSHLNSLQKAFLIHDFYAEFLRLFEF